MDLSHDNRVVFGMGTQVNFLPADRDDIVQGWTPKRSNAQAFSPRKILLQDDSAKTCLLSDLSSKFAHTMNIFDTETGKNLSELHVKNTMSEIDMPLKDFTPNRKFAQLQHFGTPNVLENIAISDNMVFKICHDLRVKPVDLVITEKAEVKTRGLSFTCVATTRSAEVAVGTSTGDIKLYSDPHAKWSQAKTSISMFSDKHPVRSLDISQDGHWLLWTTRDYVVLLDVSFLDPASGRTTTGFHASIPADLRKTAMTLRLTDEELEVMGHAEKEFAWRDARFDTAGAALGGTEAVVVASLGAYILSWNFRQLVLDYRRLKDENRNATMVRPKITAMAAPVLDTRFEWDNKDPVVVAAAEGGLSRLNLNG
jgi:hypothetical protein